MEFLASSKVAGCKEKCRGLSSCYCTDVGCMPSLLRSSFSELPFLGVNAVDKPLLMAVSEVFRRRVAGSKDVFVAASRVPLRRHDQHMWARPGIISP